MLPTAAVLPGPPPSVMSLVSYVPGNALATAVYTSPAGETYTDVNGITQTAAANVPRDAAYISAVRTLLLSTSDSMTLPWSATPVAMTVYVKVIDQGFTAAAATADVVVCSIGTGNNRFTILATATGYKLNYRVASVDHLATDNTNLAVSGDVLEFRATLSSAGAVGLSHTRNGGVESTPAVLSGSTTLGADTFTRANSTTTLGTADTGGAWTAFTTAGITSNKGYWVTDRSGGNFATLTAASAPDTVSVDCTTSNIHYNSAGPAIRFTDASNWIRLTFVNGVGLLETSVAGTHTTRGTYTTTLPTSGAATYTATMTIASNVVSCFVNGVAIGTPYTLSAGEITAFAASLNYGVAGSNAGTNGTACTFDNFTATVGVSTVALPAAWDTATIPVGSLSGANAGAMAITAITVAPGVLSLTKVRTATKHPISAGADTTPASIVLSPAFVSTTVGVNTNFSAVVYNSAGSVLSSAPVLFTSDTTGVATIDGSTGVMAAVAVGSCVITATTSGGITDTTAVNVTPNSNQPAGMTTIVDFTGHSQESWLNAATGLNTTAPSGQAGPWTWVYDNDLQDTVLRLTYGPWTVPSTSTYGPGHGYISISAALAKSVYVRALMKLSSNWVQHPTSVLKVFEGFTLGERFIVGVYGATGNEKEMVANDNGSDPNYGGYFLGQPGSGVTPPPTVITKGKWHTYEALLVLNTPGVSDGCVDTWLDGVKQTEVDNVQWEPSSDTSTRWAQFDCNALWGGLGGSLTVAQYLDIGPIHIAGTATKLAPLTTAYYVAAAGSDTTGNGTQATPYKTFTKAISTAGINSAFYGNGGDTFRETVTLGANGQTIGSYGTGNAIISGANVITGWAAAGVGTNTWKVALAAQTFLVFVNNVRATLGASSSTLNNGEWFWASGVLYLRQDAGNPDVVAPAVVVEASQRNYCIDQNGKTGFIGINVVCQRSQHTTLGAVYLHGASTLDGFTLASCTVKDNYTTGIYLANDAAGGLVTGCTVTTNGQHGIYYAATATSGSTAQTVTSNTVTNNGWRLDGAVNYPAGIIGSVRSGTVASNTVTGNGATGSGGNAHGIHLSGDLAPGLALLVHDNTVSGHTQGRGLKCTQDATIYNNILHDNTYGGALVGPTTGTQNCTVLFHHNLAYSNATLGGAGVDASQGANTGLLSFSGYNNTLYHNAAGSSSGELFVENNLSVLNWKNNAIYASGTGTKYVRAVTQTGTVAIDYNDYYGGDATTPFVYNAVGMSLATWKTQAFTPDAHAISSDPLFTISGTPPFTLQSTSPCIDAGTVISTITTGYLGAAPDIGWQEKA